MRGPPSLAHKLAEAPAKRERFLYSDILRLICSRAPRIENREGLSYMMPMIWPPFLADGFLAKRVAGLFRPASPGIT